MKTRISFVSVQLICLNPYNGWEADVPNEMFNQYMAAFRRLDEMQAKLAEYMQPQAERVDQQMAEYLARKGLTLVKVEDSSS